MSCFSTAPSRTSPKNQTKPKKISKWGARTAGLQNCKTGSWQLRTPATNYSTGAKNFNAAKIFILPYFKWNYLRWCCSRRRRRRWRGIGGHHFSTLHFVVQLLKRGSCGASRGTHTANLCAAIKNKAARCELNASTLFTQSGSTLPIPTGARLQWEYPTYS